MGNKKIPKTPLFKWNNDDFSTKILWRNSPVFFKQHFAHFVFPFSVSIFSVYVLDCSEMVDSDFIMIIIFITLHFGPVAYLVLSKAQDKCLDCFENSLSK